MFKLLMRA